MEIIEELCLRLPWGLKGYLMMESHETGDPHLIVELKGVNLGGETPTLTISVPGFQSSWSCSPEMFIPILKRPENSEELNDLLKCLREGIDFNDLIGRGLAKDALSS